MGMGWSRVRSEYPLMMEGWRVGSRGESGSGCCRLPVPPSAPVLFRAPAQLHLSLDKIGAPLAAGWRRVGGGWAGVDLEFELRPSRTQ